MLRIYPAPAVVILVACGIALSYASQQQQNYDPQWLAISSVLFISGVLVAYSIMQKLPKQRVRIAMTRVTWERAKVGFAGGIVSVVAAFAWLLWGANLLPAGDANSAAFVVVPSLVLGVGGLALVYYWLGLWAFGEIVRVEPPAAATEAKEPESDPP